MTPERWLPIPGYEGMYDVSDLGRVRSWHGGAASRPISTRATDHVGHPKVALCREGRVITKTVHQLVLLAFVGPRPDGLLTRHLDGNASNNSLSNLAYGTSSENVRDAVHHGVHAKTAVTHCPQGHPYSPENTYTAPRGARYCLTCRRENDRRRQPARKNRRRLARVSA